MHTRKEGNQSKPLQEIINSQAKTAREEERRKVIINLQKTTNKMTLVLAYQ